MMKIKNYNILYSFALVIFVSVFSHAQDIDKAKEKSARKAKDFVYEANTLIEKDDFVSAEMEYRKAISEQENNVAGAYNLGHSYYTKGNLGEALFRNKEAAKNATTKLEKHRAYHNIGNILMKNKKCKEAVVAFKDALRNNPKDEETRYNFALAKECAEQQKNDGGGKDNKEDDKKENEDKEKEQDKKDKEKKEDEKEKDKKEDQGDKDKKKGDDQKDENGKPKDDKKDEKKGDKEKPQQKPKPQPGKMSPQQIKNILEAMNNQEQKVQQKINAKKQKGARVKTEKDW